jgi:hypothetical protein
MFIAQSNNVYRRVARLGKEVPVTISVNITVKNSKPKGDKKASSKGKKAAAADDEVDGDDANDADE